MGGFIEIRLCVFSVRMFFDDKMKMRTSLVCATCGVETRVTFALSVTTLSVVQVRFGGLATKSSLCFLVVAVSSVTRSRARHDILDDVEESLFSFHRNKPPAVTKTLF
jgi:hypothetical protein